MTLSRLVNNGLLTVYGPLVSFVVACGLIANWVANNVLSYEKSDFVVAMTVIAAIPIGWLWWSYKIVKWKYWAFSRIEAENGFRLYEKAIAVGLIWPTGSIFNRTEIWTKKDKENWKTLSPEIRAIFEINTEK